MALIFADRVKETTTTTGTGAYTLAGAITGFQAFSEIGDGNTCHYLITDGTDWEVGLGTYTLAGTLLARTTIYDSSNAGAAVNWGPGTRYIGNAPIAEFASKTPLIDAAAAITGAWTFDDANALVRDSADPTKQVRIDAGAVATGTTRVITMPDQDVDLTPGTTFSGVMRGHIAGLRVSNNGTDSDHDIDIAVGEAAADDQTFTLVLASTLTKQIDAAWVVGTNAGGLDTGTVAADTWYHIFLIRRSDTGVVDALFSTSATSPTMPTNYDQKRRIRSVLTDGSANITADTQDGHEILWSVPRQDVNETAPGTGSELKTMSAPLGVKTKVISSWTLNDTGTNRQLFILSPDQADTPPTPNLADLITQASNTDRMFVVRIVRTNTSSQVRRRLASSGASTVVRATTQGYIDDFGRYV